MKIAETQICSDVIQWLINMSVYFMSITFHWNEVYIVAMHITQKVNNKKNIMKYLVDKKFVFNLYSISVVPNAECHDVTFQTYKKYI